MAVKREYKRHIAKLEAEVTADGHILKGTTVRLSEKGFFVRSQQSFIVSTPVEIRLYLTEDNFCRLKGVIKYARSGDIFKRDNGMGIELTERDPKYLEFIRSLED